MSKWSALVDFFESFGWAAYDEMSVPDDAGDRYITYETPFDNYGSVLPVTLNLYDRNESKLPIFAKIDEILQAIETMNPPGIPVPGGRLLISKGSPFAQPFNSEPFPWKRYALNINIEFLTN